MDPLSVKFNMKIFKELFSEFYSNNYLVWLLFFPLILDVFYIHFHDSNNGMLLLGGGVMLVGIISFYRFTKYRTKASVDNKIKAWLFLYLMGTLGIYYTSQSAMLLGVYSFILLYLIILILIKCPTNQDINKSLGIFLKILFFTVLLSLFLYAILPPGNFTETIHPSRSTLFNDLIPRLHGIYTGPGMFGFVGSVIAIYFSQQNKGRFSSFIVLTGLCAVILSDSRSALAGLLISNIMVITYYFYKKIKIDRVHYFIFFIGLFHLMSHNLEGFSHREQIWNEIVNDSVSNEISAENIDTEYMLQKKKSDLTTMKGTKVAHNIFLQIKKDANTLMMTYYMLVYFFLFVILIKNRSLLGITISSSVITFSMFEYGLIPSKLNTWNMLLIFSLLISFKPSQEKLT